MARGIACGSFVLVSYTFIAAICSLSFFSLSVLAKASVAAYFNVLSSLPGGHSSPHVALLWCLLVLSALTTLLAFACSCCCLKSKGCGIFCVAMLVTGALIAEQVLIQKYSGGQNETLERLEANLNLSLPLYRNTTSVSKFWDTLQTKKHCCGLDGPEDWHNIFNDNSTLPSSCCTEQSTPCTQGTTMQSGCVLKVTTSLRETYTAIHAITLFIFALEILTIIVGLCACCCLGPTQIMFDSKILTM